MVLSDVAHSLNSSKESLQQKKGVYDEFRVEIGLPMSKESLANNNNTRQRQVCQVKRLRVTEEQGHTFPLSLRTQQTYLSS